VRDKRRIDQNTPSDLETEILRRLMFSVIAWREGQAAQPFES
jgi:hypothetical protein